MDAEKYLALVLLISPGFIASGVVSMLGVTSPKHNEFDAVMRYFLCSLFSIAMVIIMAIKTGIIQYEDTWEIFIQKCTSIDVSVSFFI